MMKKKVILSYDYELFFGVKSGTVQKSLIEPTDKILAAMEDVGFKGNFFIDVLMIKCLKQNNDDRSKSDLLLIEKQLKDIVRRGHRIELHLHPHWVDAVYNGDGTWNYNNFTHYSLSSFSENEITAMFIDGTKYLNELASSVQPEYKICAFRAGGWAVQPFSMLKKGFVESGIRIDSSGARGIYVQHENSKYDFRNMPEDSMYSFEEDVCKKSENGSFLEVPINTYNRNFICSIVHKLSQKIHGNYNGRLTDGTHFRADELQKRTSKIHNLLHPKNAIYMLSFSQANPFTIKYVLKHTKYKLYCFIDHPKDFSKATCDGIKSIGNFCESILYNDLK